MGAAPAHLLLCGLLLQACLAAAASDLKIVQMVEEGDLDSLEQTLFEQPELVDKLDSTGRRPLMVALQMGDQKMVSILLANGANVTKPEKLTLESPLHIAVRQKQYQMLSLLFAYAADPDQRDKSGISPRQAAGLNERLIEMFRKYDKGGAEAFEDPPGLWVRQADTITGAPYYFNTQTSETQRMPPPSCSWKVGEVDGHPVYINKVTQQTRWTRPTALCWRRVVLPEVDNPFWLNYKSNSTVVEIPAELPLTEYERLMESTNMYWHNEVTGESSWEDPRQNTWRPVLDKETGKTFYYHPETMEAKWQPPEEVAWKEIDYSKEAGDGQKYFYNEATGASQWEKPAWLGWNLHDEL
mmetsp:Transcript_14190/g.40216  ORF Transcript_14190/g.40216 Transcript_14190/m.40216 type:complete len:355 (+) Transcript_14190:277-1341(+)